MKNIIDEEVKFEDINPKNRPVVSKTDIKGNILYANKMFAELSGYSKEELTGKPHNIVRHPDMPKKVFENLWNTILQGKPWSGIVKNLRKDGRYYWVEAYIEPCFDKKGNITGFISARRKIDDEKKKEYEKKYKEMKKNES
ncbi:PAS sensor domain-containing protein [Caminibacter mediatlanticus TB-2]|uniref:Methyl-accepting chemotaxis sensory transducer with Pas/Pac sensor n=1 Tax=Caminibacter mediatlanticus TB-2 TaxID=391592 RepID=A0AAI9F279_9BACT|nr:PAS sensor domain-containing protein [Caminibacter mediatlanticus]EDM23316.1 methyl-accepting chemotaxis sensory transducer with Pas/Pac sensor [Caminibacter mediatlanticus TB-2]QCT93763.1 PAS sensor domain-containing protein [Caminibacter mediatlanticus TB-2]